MNGDDFANQSLIGCNPKLGLCPMHLDENHVLKTIGLLLISVMACLVYGFEEKKSYFLRSR